MVVQDEEGDKSNLQIGVVPSPNYCTRLSSVLRRGMERYDLGTAQMEALTAWASTVMGSPSLSSSLGLAMLMRGLRASDLIMNDPKMLEVAVTSALMAHEDIRHAAILSQPGKPPEVIVHYR